MPRRKRILIWIAGFVMVVGAYLCVYGPQTVDALLAWNTGRKLPLVKITPTELKDFSINSDAGSRLSYFGYSFEIPWTDIDESKSTSADRMQVVAFQSRMTLIVASVPPREFVSYVAKETGGEELFKAAYGERIASSDYTFYRALLATTPQSINLFGTRQAAARNLRLLFIKALALTQPASTGIYLLYTPTFQGFQFGDPGARPNRIHMNLYDERGTAEITVVCNAECSAPITQADLNRISQSLVRVAPSEAPTSIPTKGNSKLTASR